MIVLESNYSKKIGLPGYSSHQFSITLRTEITDLAQVQAESARLYKLLQEGVDTSIQQVGFLPSEIPIKQRNGSQGTNGNGNGNHGTNGSDTWECSPKQRDLIIKVVEEHKLDKTEIEKLAHGIKDRMRISLQGISAFPDATPPPPPARH